MRSKEEVAEPSEADWSKQRVAAAKRHEVIVVKFGAA